MTSCSACGAPVGPDAIIDGVGQCPSCGHIFEAAAVDARAVTSRSPAPIALPMAPDSVELRAVDDGVELILPWRHQVTAGTMLFMLMFAGGAWVVAVGSLIASGLGAWMIMLIASVFGYAVVAAATNYTTLTVTPHGLEVSHGPLLTHHFDATYTPPQLRLPRIETRMRTFRGRYGTEHTIILHDLVTPHGKLLRNCTEAESLEFVQACIEAIVAHRVPLPAHAHGAGQLAARAGNTTA